MKVMDKALSGDNWLYEEVVHSIFYAFSDGVMN
jgi:hypothetical protein